MYYILRFFREHLKTSEVRQGLIGCFRGLVVNGEILDIHSYMSVHLSEIIKDCKPSCQPNKCQNGARCVELWSNFECVCENRWAHQGTFCETSKIIAQSNIPFPFLLIFFSHSNLQ